MCIEQAAMGSHIHQSGTAVPVVPATEQSWQTEGAGTELRPVSVLAPETVSHVTEVSNPLQSANRVMEFTIDPESGKHVVKIMDSSSHELIRQIPMEEALALARSLDQLKGMLLYAKA
jgi:flagellar protein FlaG